MGLSLQAQLDPLDPDSNLCHIPTQLLASRQDAPEPSHESPWIIHKHLGWDVSLVALLIVHVLSHVRWQTHALKVSGLPTLAETNDGRIAGTSFVGGLHCQILMTITKLALCVCTTR